MFAIPGLGPILVAGPLAAWIVAALENAVVGGGVSALGAGLVSIGIPKNSVVDYEYVIKSDKFLLVVHGSTETVAHAREVIAGTHHVAYTCHGENVYAASKPVGSFPRCCRVVVLLHDEDSKLHKVAGTSHDRLVAIVRGVIGEVVPYS